jgi:hypothetical protein
MKRTLLILALAAVSSVAALDDQSEQAKKLLQQQTGIKINHWVLAKPNGQPITSLDLAKRLEVVFYQNYPNYATSQQARLQFYNQAWRDLLSDQIDNQLMLADAEEKQVKASDADVRQELESMFGPNVVETLDELGLTYTEAWEMVREDLLVQQMRGHMIAAKANMTITPEKLRSTYEKYAEQYELVDQCEYQMLTIRHQNSELAQKAAKRAEELVVQGLTLPQVYDKLSDERLAGTISPSVNMRVSDMEKRPVNSLATAYREVLDGMKVGATSGAIEQKSRDGSSAFRVYHLEAREVDSVPEFEEMVDQIRSALFQQAYAVAQEDYLSRLRTHYGIDQTYLASMIPSDFTPFTL